MDTKYYQVSGYVSDFSKGSRKKPGTICVKYMVGGNSYTIQEEINYRTKQLRLGPIAFPRLYSPMIRHVDFGAVMTIRFLPNNPSRAYIVENSLKSAR